MFKSKVDGKKTCIGDIYADDFLELSDDDDDKATELTREIEVNRDVSFISKPDLIDCNVQCLPSAGKLFETITKPHFLEAEKKAEIDWEKIISNKSHEDEIKCTNTNAVPPPQSYESQTPSLKPTLGDTTVLTPNLKRPMANEVEQESTDGPPSGKIKR